MNIKEFREYLSNTPDDCATDAFLCTFEELDSNCKTTLLGIDLPTIEVGTFHELYSVLSALEISNYGTEDPNTQIGSVEKLHNECRRLLACLIVGMLLNDIAQIAGEHGVYVEPYSDFDEYDLSCEELLELIDETLAQR